MKPGIVRSRPSPVLKDLSFLPNNARIHGL